MNCLITANASLPRGAAGRVGRYLIAREVDRLVRRHDGASWTGLASQDAHESLPPSLRKAIDTYNRGHGASAEHADYGPLHRLADALDRRALERGEDSGLVRHGMSVFRVAETRWIHPLLLQYVSYVEMLAQLLREHPGARVHTLSGAGFCERAASRLADARGGARPVVASAGPSRWLLAALQARSERPRHAFPDMLRHWLDSGAPAAWAEPAPKKRRRILFAGYRERTLRRLELLAPVLLRELDAELVILSDFPGSKPQVDASIKRLENLGFTALWASDLVPREEARHHASRARSLAKAALPRFFEQPFELSCHGIDLYPEARPFLESIALEGSPVTALFAELAERVVRSVKPDLIVHFEEWELNRALCLRSTGAIPNLAYYCLSPELQAGIVRRLPGRLAVAGARLAADFRRTRRWRDADVEIVGDPAADLTGRIDRAAAKAAVCERLGLSRDRPLVTLFASYADSWISETELEQLYLRTVEGARGVGAQLLIKAHPQQDLKAVRGALARAGAAETALVQHGDLLELAAAADLAVLFMTTAASQIMSVGTPIVSIQPDAVQAPIEELHRYRGDADIPVLGLDEDATSTFRTLLTDAAAREHQIKRGLACAAGHMGAFDGASATRFAALARKILAEANP